MKYVYPACFYKEDDCYSVLFSDFECATQGDNLTEAMAMAAEAAAGWIIGSLERGEPLPKSTPLENVQPDDGGFASFVYINLEELKPLYDEKPVKKTLTIPSWLNQAAERKSVNFSVTLKEALIEKLAQ